MRAARAPSRGSSAADRGVILKVEPVFKLVRRIGARCRPEDTVVRVSSPGFPGEGDHAQHGGGALGQGRRRAPPPRFARSPSPGNPGEEISASSALAPAASPVLGPCRFFQKGCASMNFHRRDFLSASAAAGLAAGLPFPAFAALDAKLASTLDTIAWDVLRESPETQSQLGLD